MFLIAITWIICLQVTYCSGDNLTPKQFDEILQGYDFCAHGNAQQFKAMCIKIAKKLKLHNYDESEFNNLECRQFTVYLMENLDTKVMDERTANLLECVIERYDRITQKKYLGRGKGTNDVYYYEPNRLREIVPIENYENFLLSIFQPPKNNPVITT